MSGDESTVCFTEEYDGRNINRLNEICQQETQGECLISLRSKIF